MKKEEEEEEEEARDTPKEMNIHNKRRQRLYDQLIACNTGHTTAGLGRILGLLLQHIDRLVVGWEPGWGVICRTDVTREVRRA